jgi:hypothetical protein
MSHKFPKSKELFQPQLLLLRMNHLFSDAIEDAYQCQYKKGLRVSPQELPPGIGATFAF